MLWHGQLQRLLLAGALDETAPRPTDLRKRLPKHKSRGAQKQDGDGEPDDDIRPERLEPGYETGRNENRPVGDQVVPGAQPSGPKVDVVRPVSPEKREQ